MKTNSSIEEFLLTFNQEDVKMIPDSKIRELRYVLGRYHYTKEQQDKWLQLFIATWMLNIIKNSKDTMPKDLHKQLEEAYVNNKYEGIKNIMKIIQDKDPRAFEVFSKVIIAEYTKTLDHFLQETSR